MSFQYQTYYYALFQRVVNFLWLVIPTSIIIPFQLYRHIKRKNKKAIIETVFALLCMLIFIMLLFGEIWKSKGIYFLDETEDMAVGRSGKITRIIEPTEYARMKVEGYYGADLYIDDERYLIVTAEGYDVGDVISIEYLPKSKCILRIEKDE